MNRFSFNIFASLLLAAFLVAIIRFFHPAAFSLTTLYILSFLTIPPLIYWLLNPVNPFSLDREKARMRVDRTKKPLIHSLPSREEKFQNTP